MVKLTAWTKFLTDYHKKSGNAKLSKSMKEASPLYKKHNGKMGKSGKHGRKRGGEVVPEVVPPVVPDVQEVVPEGVQPTEGGRSRKRKGSKKSKTRRR